MSEPHNSFDIKQVGDKFEARSHNFPEFVGVGTTEAEAVNLMDRMILYYRDNNPAAYVDRIKARIKKGLACDCGIKLDGQVLGVIGGG